MSPSLNSALKELFQSFVPVENPTGGEDELLGAVERWLTGRGIEYQSDRSWGIFFEVNDQSETPRVARRRRPSPILLMAHLDSEPRSLSPEALASIKYDFFSEHFIWQNGPVGLDCKMGLVMCLAIAEQIQDGRVPGGCVRFMFNVAEEIGQRGLLRMPLPILKSATHGVKLAIALDRTTECGSAVDVNGHPVEDGQPPVRHVVNHYLGVDLVPPSQRAAVARLLNMSTDACRVPRLAAVASRNCSDVLELKIRHDCELVLPSYLKKLRIGGPDCAPMIDGLDELQAEYKEATAKVKNAMALMERTDPSLGACSMRKAPRSTRYAVNQRVSQRLSEAHLKIPRLSVLNLSYSQADPPMNWDGSCSLAEMSETARITLAIIYHHQQ